MLLSIEEFRGEVERRQRDRMRSQIPAGAAALGALILWLTAPFVQNWWGQKAAVWLVWPMLFLFAAAFVLLFVGVTRADRAIKQRTVLHCDHCRGALHTEAMKEIVIASRHCPTCGRQVLRAADNDSPKL